MKKKTSKPSTPAATAKTSKTKASNPKASNTAKNNRTQAANKRLAETARDARQPASEQFTEKLELLRLVAVAGKPISEAKLATLKYGDNTDTLRTKVRRALKAIQGDIDAPEAEGLYGLRRTGVNDGKSYEWQADNFDLIAAGIDSSMPAEKALAFILLKNNLGELLPAASALLLKREFEIAQKRISQNINPSEKKDLNRLLKRVKVIQRGQELKKYDNVDPDILNTIYEAIAGNRCIRISYQKSSDKTNEHALLHPAGVLVRLPKLYLYAANTEHADNPARYHAYQINLITAVEILQDKSRIPAGFDMNLFVADGNADVLVDFKDGKEHQVKIEVAEAGNLVRDLHDFPLSANQTLVKQKNGKWLLSFPSRRTHQLVEYIVGRGNTFKVISPAALVSDVKTKLEGALRNYR